MEHRRGIILRYTANVEVNSVRTANCLARLSPADNNTLVTLVVAVIVLDIQFSLFDCNYGY